MNLPYRHRCKKKERGMEEGGIYADRSREEEERRKKNRGQSGSDSSGSNTPPPHHPSIKSMQRILAL
jgi:hypothetical protein